eukprot:SAG11_NODE_34151_length_273_cov_1.155172_1_plen_49_part_10
MTRIHPKTLILSGKYQASVITTIFPLINAFYPNYTAVVLARSVSQKWHS